MIVAETNGQAEQWLAGAAGQVTRTSADQEVTHNTTAQDIEDGADRAWKAVKNAAADLVDRGPEAVTDAFGAAERKIEETWNSVGNATRDNFVKSGEVTICLFSLLSFGIYQAPLSFAYSNDINYYLIIINFVN